VTSLAEMVDLLIKENRQLRRALARAEKTQGSGNLGQAAKALSGLQGRIARALDSSPTTRRQRLRLLRQPASRRDARLWILMC
jgi:hypothetical protein